MQGIDKKVKDMFNKDKLKNVLHITNKKYDLFSSKL